MLFIIILSLLIVGAVTIAAVSDSEPITCISGGTQVKTTLGKLRQVEQECMREDKEAWRKNAVLVAAVEATHLRPPVVWGETPAWKLSTHNDTHALSITTPTWIAEYRVIAQSSHDAKVVLNLGDTPKYMFSLKRPIKDWWYITGISDMSRSGAGPVTPKGAQLVELRPTVMKHNLRLTWNPATKIAEVIGVNINARMQVGYDQARINGREFNCSACPMLIKGKLLVAEDVMSRIIAESLAAKK